jgi:hypothetical protein
MVGEDIQGASVLYLSIYLFIGLSIKLSSYQVRKTELVSESVYKSVS